MLQSLKRLEVSVTELLGMSDIRFQKVLYVQGLFLILLFFFTFIAIQFHIHSLFLISIWLTSMIGNLIFLKKFALPSKELTWNEIEKSLAQKDVDLQKQKEEYEQENFKYKLLLDSLQDPVCILNNEMLILYANHAFNQLFDCSDEKLPVPLIEISRNLDFQEFLEHAVEDDRPSTRTYFSFNPLHDPHKSYYDLKVFPVEQIQNYLCLLHDVTERKMADQMREDFVANFSHEVRTPLTILNGQMQNLKSTLQKESDFESRFADIFIKIENNSRRLINLFNDLLRLNSIESKKEIHKEEIDIEEMLTFLTSDLLLNYPDKKIQFEIDLEQTLFLVDYNLFEQVLINLIDNSLKYIEHSGVISITSYHEHDWDYLIIKDNGVGIPEDQVHRIFERFFRVDTSRSSEIKGTGLGLSIVKHILQKHEGKIKAQSQTNVGTTFTLAFPSH